MRDKDGFPNPLDFEREEVDRGDLDRHEAHRPGFAPAPRGRMRGVGRPWHMSGVGSAAGYTGFGGPGWSGGGFGDPGYNTSGFASPDYGASRVGGGRDRNLPNYYSEEPYGAYGMDAHGGQYGGRGEYDRGQNFGTGHATNSTAVSYRGKGPKGFRRSDERISEMVCDLLTYDHRVDASNIDVSVANGEVTLSGTVPSRDMKWLAEDLTERVSGVVDVHNRLKSNGSR